MRFLIKYLPFIVAGFVLILLTTIICLLYSFKDESNDTDEKNSSSSNAVQVVQAVYQENDRKNASLPPMSKYLQPGDYDFNSGDSVPYYHGKPNEYFRPANPGETIHFIIRSATNPDEYLEQYVTVSEKGTIPDKNINTVYNTLGTEYGEYWFIFLKGGKITYSHTGLPAK